MYLAMKTLHVLAVVLFLGNIITGLFWKAHGDRTADPRIIAHTLEGIIRSDRWFTIPGVVLIVAFGVGGRRHRSAPDPGHRLDLAVDRAVCRLGTGVHAAGRAPAAPPPCVGLRGAGWRGLGTRRRTVDSRAGGSSGEPWPF